MILAYKSLTLTKEKSSRNKTQYFDCKIQKSEAPCFWHVLAKKEEDSVPLEMSILMFLFPSVLSHKFQATLSTDKVGVAGGFGGAT
jgi:hypothetical protein